MLVYSIISNNVDICSGACKYCTPASCMGYKQLTVFNTDTIIKTLRTIDEANFKKWKRDWEAVYRRIFTDPRYQMEENHDKISFDLWGADPLTNLLIMKETVKELRKIAERLRYKKVIFTASTNGLPLLRDDVYSFVVENKILVQLSHDGLGQYIRTNSLDPLDFDHVKDLIRIGLLTTINATLNGKNYDLFKNMDYFYQKIYKNEYTKPGYAKLYIKLNHIAESDDEEFNLTGRALDQYMHGWQVIDRRIHNNTMNNIAFWPFKKYFIEQISRRAYLKSFYSESNNCRDYQIGIKPYSYHIDTMGEYSKCNLIDSKSSTKNDSNKLPKYCNDCEYKLSEACNPCGQLGHRTSHCDYYYRWNKFLDECEISREKEKTR